MYCILNWLSTDYCDLSLVLNEDGTVKLFRTYKEAEETALDMNGKTIVVKLWK